MAHEYRRFVQSELDARGWKPAELVRRSGLRRQLIWKILHDDRPSLGQMPDDSTIERLARGFGIPSERVRVAAARSLDGYVNGQSMASPDVAAIPTEVLFAELRRRIPSDRVVSDQSEELPWGRGIRPGPPGEDPGMGRNEQSG